MKLGPWRGGCRGTRRAGCRSQSRSNCCATRRRKAATRTRGPPCKPRTPEGLLRQQRTYPGRTPEDGQLRNSRATADSQPRTCPRPPAGRRTACWATAHLTSCWPRPQSLRTAKGHCCRSAAARLPSDVCPVPCSQHPRTCRSTGRFSQLQLAARRNLRWARLRTLPAPSPCVRRLVAQPAAAASFALTSAAASCPGDARVRSPGMTRRKPFSRDTGAGEYTVTQSQACGRQTDGSSPARSR